MTPLQRLRESLPDRKPQLWDHPLLATSRRLRAYLNARFDPQWNARPVRARLASVDAVMDVVPSHYIDNAIYRYGVHELASTELLLAALRPGDTFVDVGANIGYFSLIAARAVGPRGSVHAFEPVPSIGVRLESHVELNALDNVHIHRTALCDVDGSVDIFESSWDLNHGLASIRKDPSRSLTDTPRRVRAQRLDTFWASLEQPVQFVKVDVEGAEESVFRGAERMLRSADAPSVLFECTEIEKMTPLFTDAGYAVKAFDFGLASGLTFHPVTQAESRRGAAYEAPNFFAYKASRPGILDEVVRRAAPRARLRRSLRAMRSRWSSSRDRDGS